MERAVVAIGVKKTGGLPELQAAVESATAFAAWARQTQGISAGRVKLITDQKGVVGRDRIFDAVETITKLGFIEQLIVYFSGHGINSGMHEQWLLSKAPDDPGAAVNVKGSEFAARFCGIGHVVLISDACRTAADSIQAQNVTGASIFPNPKPTGPERPVDQFFATLVGDPALEVRSVQDAVDRFKAAYSTVLLEALHGKVPELIDSTGGTRVIRPRPLKRHLAGAVPAFLHGLGLRGGSTQQPDARIESDEDALLAEIRAPKRVGPPAIPAASPRRRAGQPRGRVAPVGGDIDLPPPALSGAGRAPRSVVTEAGHRLSAVLRPTDSSRRLRASGGGADLTLPGAHDRFGQALSAAARVFGPAHFETECGIKVRGAGVADAFCPAAHATVRVGTGGDVVQVDLKGPRAAANVLVTLTDRSLVLVPAFRGYVAGLTVDDGGRLSDVWYEPSANTALGQAFATSAGEVRGLRAVVAAASSLGVFRLDEGADADRLLQQLRSMKALDPALAIYAAYALHERRMRAPIGEMAGYLAQQLRATIFDVAMLSFSMPRGKRPRGTPPVFPSVPMLAQGWALLSPLEISLGRLDDLRSHLRASLWTHFQPTAAETLRAAIDQENE